MHQWAPSPDHLKGHGQGLQNRRPSLLNAKAATLRHASNSPIHTAPAGSPATPRLPGFVEVLHLAPAGRHTGGDDFASVRCWGGLTLTTALREGSFFSSF